MYDLVLRRGTKKTDNDSDQEKISYLSNAIDVCQDYFGLNITSGVDMELLMINAFNLRAACYKDMGKLEAAYCDIREAKRLLPHTLLLPQNAESYETSYHEQAQSLHEIEWNLLSLLGDSAFDKNEHREAISFYLEAVSYLERQPASNETHHLLADTYFNLAECYIQERDKASAHFYYSLASRLYGKLVTLCAKDDRPRLQQELTVVIKILKNFTTYYDNPLDSDSDKEDVITSPSPKKQKVMHSTEAEKPSDNVESKALSKTFGFFHSHKASCKQSEPIAAAIVPKTRAELQQLTHEQLEEFLTKIKKVRFSLEEKLVKQKESSVMELH